MQLQRPVLHGTAWRHGTRVHPICSHEVNLPRVAGKLSLLLRRDSLHVRQCHALTMRQAGIVDRPVVLGAWAAGCLYEAVRQGILPRLARADLHLVLVRSAAEHGELSRLSERQLSSRTSTNSTHHISASYFLHDGKMQPGRSSGANKCIGYVYLRCLLIRLWVYSLLSGCSACETA